MLVVLITNDYVLKRAMPDEVTGKLSDIAGLVLLPLAVVSVVEAVRYVIHRERWQTTTGELLGAIAVAALGFIAVKSSNAVGQTYGDVLGAVRWLPATGIALIERQTAPTMRPVLVTHDVTDLLALPALALAWLNAAPVTRRQRFGSRPQPCTQTSDRVHPA